MLTRLLQPHHIFLMKWRAQASFLESAFHRPQFLRAMQEDDRQTATIFMLGYSSWLWIDYSAVHLLNPFDSADFTMHVQNLTKLILWVFAMDHVNNAQWVSVHIQDFIHYILGETHPNIFHHFCSGLFVSRKTKCMFSAIVLGHAQTFSTV